MATQYPKTRGEIDPFNEPPPEVLAEIQEGLDGIYGPSVEGDGGLGAEVQLTNAQSRTAILYYLAHIIQNDGWYKPPSRGSAYKRGIAAEMSTETGIGDALIRETLRDGGDQGLLEIETKVTRTGKSTTNARATQLCHDAIDLLRVERPEDVETIDSFFVRNKRLTIMLVRKEINAERKELGREPVEFEAVVALHGLTALCEELARLQHEQAKLLTELNSSFAARR